MTQEDKELLLRDLCTRLLYDLKCKLYLDKYCAWNPEYDKILADAAKVRPELPSKIREKTYTLYGIEGNRAILLEFEDHGYGVPIEFIKPYLRPMSSMTHDECTQLFMLLPKSYIVYSEEIHNIDELTKILPEHIETITDFYNSHYIDWRGLIPQGLALEAPEGMYK